LRFAISKTGYIDRVQMHPLFTPDGVQLQPAQVWLDVRVRVALSQRKQGFESPRECK